MPSLSTLPAEVLVLVLSYVVQLSPFVPSSFYALLDRQSALSTVRLVNKACNDTVTPLLLRHIAVGSESAQRSLHWLAQTGRLEGQVETLYQGDITSSGPAFDRLERMLAHFANLGTLKVSSIGGDELGRLMAVHPSSLQRLVIVDCSRSPPANPLPVSPPTSLRHLSWGGDSQASLDLVLGCSPHLESLAVRPRNLHLVIDLLNLEKFVPHRLRVRWAYCSEYGWVDVISLADLWDDRVKTGRFTGGQLDVLDEEPPYSPYLLDSLLQDGIKRLAAIVTSSSLHTLTLPSALYGMSTTPLFLPLNEACEEGHVEVVFRTLTTWRLRSSDAGDWVSAQGHSRRPLSGVQRSYSPSPERSSGWPNDEWMTEVRQ